MRAGVAGLCAVGVAASLISYRGEKRLEESFLSVVQGKPTAETVELLDSSDTLNPDTRRDTGKATFFAGMGRVDEAEAIMRDAARREPENMSVWLSWARIRLSLGRRDAAREAYSRAKELDPQLPRDALPPPP